MNQHHVTAETSQPRGAKAKASGKRVLVLHQHYWPEIAATAQILTDLCEDLAAFGHDVTVICGQPSYRVTKAQKELVPREHRRGVDIHRVWSYTPEVRTIPRRLLHYGSFFGASLAAAVSAKKPDVRLVMSTPPILLGVSGTLLTKLRGVPFIYSVQDLYPDIAVHLGVLREDSPATAAIEHAARVTYGAAAALVALSPSMGKRLAAKQVDPARIHVIPNWADTSAVLPTARDNAFAREHGLADGFVVQYSGNMGMSQGLEAVVSAASQLRDLPITFAMVGDGNARERLEAAAGDYRLDNMKFIMPQPRERLGDLLGACDVGLVTMKRGVGADLVPSKLYGIMAAARPVLAAVERDTEVARTVREHECGWTVEPEDAGALAAGIRQAFDEGSDIRLRLGENGRVACASSYSRVALTRKYHDLICDVVKR